MTFNKVKIRQNMQRRMNIINKASGDCWWVKQYIIGNMYFNKVKKGD